MTTRRSRTRGAEHSPAARQVLKHFRVIFGTIKKHFHAVETSCGVAGSQLWALAEISRAPGLRVAGLAEALLIHQSTASNLADSLERGGLASKRRSTHDQRVVHLFPTARGANLLARAPSPAEGILPHAIRQLRQRELKALDAALFALVRAMGPHDTKAAARPLSDL